MKLPTHLSDPSQFRIFPRGSTIFAAGAPGDEMFIVQEGEVDIVVGDKVVETVGLHDFFGEMALIDASPRSASAVTRTGCTLLPLNQRRFTFLVDEMPFFALKVMKVMADRLRRADAEIVSS